MYQATTTSDRRAAFSDGDLSTASPARVLIKCFDRLDADLDRALAAIEGNDHEATNAQLSHAQDLLGEVAGMLDVGAWVHAAALLSVYDYILRLLAFGNMRKEPAPIAEARRLLSEIGAGFRQAATEIESRPAIANPAPAAAPVDDSPVGASQLAVQAAAASFGGADPVSRGFSARA